MLCCLGGAPETPPPSAVISSTCVSNISFTSLSSTDSPLTRVSPPTMKYPDKQIIDHFQLTNLIQFIDKPQTIQYTSSQLRTFDTIKKL